jgi:hypothetical protein
MIISYGEVEVGELWSKASKEKKETKQETLPEK